MTLQTELKLFLPIPLDQEQGEEINNSEYKIPENSDATAS